MESYKVTSCKFAERAVHNAFVLKDDNNNNNVDNKYKIYYGGGREWYEVPANKFGTFKSVIEHAIRNYRPNNNGNNNDDGGDDDDDDDMNGTKMKHLLMRLLRI